MQNPAPSELFHLFDGVFAGSVYIVVVRLGVPPSWKRLGSPLSFLAPSSSLHDRCCSASRSPGDQAYPP